MRQRLVKRPSGLVAIVVYKLFVAFCLSIAAIALSLALKNYSQLVEFSQAYLLRGKIELLKFILERILALKPSTLHFSIIATGVYAVISIIEAVGLWYEKAWATILVTALVGVTIPAEIFELFRSLSLLKLVIFLVNVFVFVYLLRHSIRPQTQPRKSSGIR